MATASIPVDLRNPGQVFACLGFMEAAEVLCGPCSGRFDYELFETQATFVLDADGPDDPITAVVAFLTRAEVKAIAPEGSDLTTARWDVETIVLANAVDALGAEYPCPLPTSPAAMPIVLTDGSHMIAVGHWADDLNITARDNVKVWAGAAGYPGAALARDALGMVEGLGANALAAAAADPFSVSAPQSSSFRFDWRRDYIPLDAGFSPNLQGAVQMIGYPLVELLAAIGLENARPERPDRRDKLSYRYGVSNAALPTVLARAVLGAQNLGFPVRTFRMQLGWPGQEGQARCIIKAEEEFAP